MRISEVMSGDVCVIAPDDTLGRAAGVMAKHDIGSLPVGENDRLVGFITFTARPFAVAALQLLILQLLHFIFIFCFAVAAAQLFFAVVAVSHQHFVLKVNFLQAEWSKQCVLLLCYCSLHYKI